MPRKRILPIASVDKILREAGAPRVSEKAACAFAEVLEEIASDLARNAVFIARHSGRKTVKSEDIKLARRL